MLIDPSQQKLTSKSLPVPTKKGIVPVPLLGDVVLEGEATEVR